MKLLLSAGDDGNNCIVANKRLLGLLLSNALPSQNVFKLSIGTKLKLALQRLTPFTVQNIYCIEGDLAGFFCFSETRSPREIEDVSELSRKIRIALSLLDNEVGELPQLTLNKLQIFSAIRHIS